jgi:hypothetical protein
MRELEVLSRRAQQTQLFIETPYRNPRCWKRCWRSLQPATRLSIELRPDAPGGFTRTDSVAVWRTRPLPSRETCRRCSPAGRLTPTAGVRTRHLVGAAFWPPNSAATFFLGLMWAKGRCATRRRRAAPRPASDSVPLLFVGLVKEGVARRLPRRGCAGARAAARTGRSSSPSRRVRSRKLSRRGGSSSNSKGSISIFFLISFSMSPTRRACRRATPASPPGPTRRRGRCGRCGARSPRH